MLKPELNSITSDGGNFRIGAATSCAVIDENKNLKKTWPGVVEAAELIGSTQIQGRASLGGNLCNASPAADTVPALAAAGATITIAGPSGVGSGEYVYNELVVGGTSGVQERVPPETVILSPRIPVIPLSSIVEYAGSAPKAKRTITS